VDTTQHVSRTWDVIVIGAGPAGAFVAARLATDGLAVLLVERKTFPRDKVCGGCVNPDALARLDAVGVTPHLHAAGGHAITSLHLHSGHRCADVPLPGGLAISRATMDSVLVRHAVEAGCVFLPDTSAFVKPGDGREDLRHVSLESRGGACVEASARVVVVAAGLGQQALRDVTPLRDEVQAGARVGVGVIAPSGVVEATDGVITMVVGRGGYVGVTRVEGNRVNLAAACDAALLKDAGGPGGAVRRLLASAGLGATSALESLEWQGTVPLTRRLSSPVAHRVFVIGDAAGYVEPFTGEGMAWALAAADGLAPVAARAVATWTSDVEQAWLRTYGTLVSRRQLRCRVIARTLRRPRMVDAVVAVLARRPGFARPFV
jgi:flavin-dependent dehydrogenase